MQGCASDGPGHWRGHSAWSAQKPVRSFLHNQRREGNWIRTLGKPRHHREARRDHSPIQPYLRGQKRDSILCIFALRAEIGVARKSGRAAGGVKTVVSGQWLVARMAKGRIDYSDAMGVRTALSTIHQPLATDSVDVEMLLVQRRVALHQHCLAGQLFQFADEL